MKYIIISEWYYYEFQFMNLKHKTHYIRYIFKKVLHHLYFIHISPQILQTAKKIIIVFIDKT